MHSDPRPQHVGRIAYARQEIHRDEWRRGIELLRTLIPETFAEGDPVAFRTVVFRMAVQEVTGREAVPGDAPTAPER